MTWKRDNPGCSPCCSDADSGCACYPLDSSGANSSGSVTLANKDGGPGWDTTNKKLGTGASEYSYGKGYLEAADNSCFSPSANTSGWAMSFWIKAITNLTGTTCPTAGSTAFTYWETYPGVVTKGYATQANAPSGGGTPSHCPSISNGVQLGEWFILMHKPNMIIGGGATTPISMQAWVNTNTVAFSDFSMQFVGAKNIDTDVSLAGAHANEWNFVYWYIRGNHSWFHVRGETETAWAQFYENINSRGGIKNDSWPLRVGTMITSTGGELRLGTKGGGSYRIDNLLFDDNPTTYGSTSVPVTSPATIPVEATALYNSGSGEQCPNAGR